MVRANLRRAGAVAGTMRRSPFLAAAVLAAALAAPAPAPAQQPPAAPPATVLAACDPHETNLGGIGRASVVAFTGPIFGARVCATVANLSFDGFTARVAAAPSSDALVTAALGDGGSAALPVEGVSVTGQFLIAPGGAIPAFGADTAEVPRVVVAYAGQRVLVIGTTAVALVDLARALRDRPGLFNADAVERAVVIASGPDAALSLRGDDGIVGAPSVTTARLLLFMKRG